MARTTNLEMTKTMRDVRKLQRAIDAVWPAHRLTDAQAESISAALVTITSLSAFHGGFSRADYLDTCGAVYDWVARAHSEQAREL